MVLRRKLIAGNWKMNGLRKAADELRSLREQALGLGELDLLVCPPATLAGLAVEVLAGSGIAVGGQDCHSKASGAHTGDVSAEMWADLGARYVIVGHSERRTDHAETDALVAAKAEAVLRAGLSPIICLGETLAQRDAGETLPIIRAQLQGSVPAGAPPERIVIAYEPVWAIGTGRTPTPGEVEAAHTALRAALEERVGAEARQTRLLYGGSVKPENADTLLRLSDVDGALVGGASLKAVDFLAIARAAL
jgi:triosephosphate isomerase